jgi:uncharacterized membrane protein YoaK (UPF0700 family)
MLTFFISGALISGLLINGRAYQGKRPLYSIPLIIAAFLTAGVGITGYMGFFGVFGAAAVDQPKDFVFLSVLSLASGLQNAAVATSTGLLVRTTHLTGPATDLGVHLAEIFFAKGKQLRLAYQHALLRSGKIIAFTGGAVAGVMLAHKIQFLALMIPSAIIFLATFISFRSIKTR